MALGFLLSYVSPARSEAFPSEWGVFGSALRFLERSRRSTKETVNAAAWLLCQAFVARAFLRDFYGRHVRADIVRSLFRRHPGSPLSRTGCPSRASVATLPCAFFSTG